MNLARSAASDTTAFVIDSDRDRLARTTDALRGCGYAVTTCENALDAFHLVRERPPDVIVSAAALSDFDSFAACHLLRGDPALGRIPVVLVADHTVTPEESRLASCAGASALVEGTPSLSSTLDAVHLAVRQGAPAYPNAAPCLGERSRLLVSVESALIRARRAAIRYQALLDHAHEAIAVLAPDGTIIDINRHAATMQGMPREHLLQRNIRDFVAPEFAADAAAEYAGLVTAGGGRSSLIPIARQDGTRRYYEFSMSAVSVDGDDLVFAIGHDVTQTLEARRALEASERKYRLLVEHIPDVVWAASVTTGTLVYISPRVTDVCGFAPEELVNRPMTSWYERIHAEDVDAARQAFTRLTVDRPYEAEYRWLHKDGTWIWIRAQAVVVERQGELVAEGTLADVTQRHHLEDQVRQSQKMEAIGRLTGGVAHDFNNILAIILGNARFLLDELPGDDPRRADAEAIMEAGERAASLTRQLLMFSRRQIVRPQRLDLNGVIRDLEKMLRRIIGEDVELSLHLTDGSLGVMADVSEIEQVLMNLVVNARDAMPKGGYLSIETTLVDLDDSCAEAHPGLTPGRYALLSVSDTGCGMDAETKRHAFEPFFTTKDRTQGTGLGLSTCYGIIHNCQGHISIYSEVGRGTAFKVYLPLLADAASDAGESTRSAPDTGGQETVLLIEDDDRLRKTVHRILEARGYTVLDSTGSGDAAAVAARHGRPIDLIVSDMVMPGLDGPATVAQLRESYPAARVLYMSGYSDHALLRRGSVEAAANFIQKPFAPQALATKVRQVLDRTDRHAR